MWSSSSGTDTYSTIAAALGSLKGPKHGGANVKVVKMFDDMKEQVKDWKDEEEVSAYLTRLLHKEAFDHAGLDLRYGTRGLLPVRPASQTFSAPSSRSWPRRKAARTNTSCIS